ncbi:MAG: MBL fold metallo-hydrolase [Candidatus Eremiobacteraeota bacterium]|nr:MBL fold metallo-hydrolase [Candidatus Eremiobacteraeota bacterium]
MAEITFCGAADTVTGSKHLLASNGKNVLLDCGLFQGIREIEALNYRPLPIKAGALDAIVITHGHVDHVGFLPKVVKDGFSGPIYCTPPTAAVIDIVLEDAAKLQVHHERRGFHVERHDTPPGLYDAGDVARTLQHLVKVDPGKPFDVAGISAIFRNAGHIIGSSFLEMQVEGKRLTFSGDLGRYGRPLLYDPATPGACDVVICESTYGDRIHPPEPQAELAAALHDGIARKGIIVIPAFAVERTQDMLYAIGCLQRTDATIAAAPVHLDSPMAIKVDAVFEAFPDAFRHPPGAPPHDFGCRNLRVHNTPDESKELNHLEGPAIIISSSGMINGGRVLYHLHRLLPDPSSTVVLVGYQSTGTLGRILAGGAPSVRMMGDTVPVRAKIVSIGGFSAHADQNELMQWLGQIGGKPRMYAVHGDPASATALVGLVKQKLGFDANVAHRGETVAF